MLKLIIFSLYIPTLVFVIISFITNLLYQSNQRQFELVIKKLLMIEYKLDKKVDHSLLLLERLDKKINSMYKNNNRL